MNRIEFTRVINRMLWNSHWTRMAAVGLILSGSSCSSTAKYVQNTFQRTPSVAAEDADKAQGNADSPDVKHAYAAAKKGSQKVEQLSQEEATGAVASVSPKSAAELRADAAAAKRAEKQAAQKRDILALIAQGQDPFGESPIQQTSNEEIQKPEPAAQQRTADAATIQHESSPRAAITAQNTISPLACPPFGDPVQSAVCNARPFPNAGLSSDEFLCNGGNKNGPFGAQPNPGPGPDVQDTLGYYKDEEGKTHMRPSTEVCVYAPRFGSVSTATLPEQGVTVNQAAGHQDMFAAGGLEAKMVVDQKTQSDEVQAMQMRSRASGLNHQAVEDHLHQAQAAENHVKLANAHEDFRFIREGQFKLANTAVLTLGVNAAQEWADGRRPIIVATDVSGQIVQGRFTAQDYTGVEDKRTPGELKLVKVANRAYAKPGDVITFTLRFDNVGQRELRSVRVVDNLSPRLEFVEGSVKSDLDGNVNMEENGVGGKLLTFEFEQPLKGGTGGFVSFECKVR